MNIKTEEIKLKEQEFYLRKFRFSFSSGSKLIEAPKVFYNDYVLGNKEDRTETYFTYGRLIHTLLLDPENYSDKFIMSPSDLPTAGSKTVVDMVFARVETYDTDNKFEASLEVHSQLILEILEEINLHQALTDDKKVSNGQLLSAEQKRLAKILTDQNKSYFNFLKIKDGKDIIDPQMLEDAGKAVEAVKENNHVMELLGLNRESDYINFASYNEMELAKDFNDYVFGLKGIADNFTVDIPNKKITINDIKTTSKSLIYFKESLDKYHYWLQAVIYRELVKSYIGSHIANIETWEIDFNFVVIDKFNQVYAYPVSEESMQKWYKDFEELCTAWNYHYSNNEYNLPYDFLIGKVYL